MTRRWTFALAIVALIALQSHVWLHADHVQAPGDAVCASCQLAQHGGTVDHAPAVAAVIAAATPRTGRAALPAPSDRFMPIPAVRGPPVALI